MDTSGPIWLKELLNDIEEGKVTTNGKNNVKYSPKVKIAIPIQTSHLE